jgi:hypothetical protein
MKWNESLYFGTWQLSEDFHLVTKDEAIEIVKTNIYERRI